MGRLRTVQEPTACGRYCTTTTRFTVEDADGTPLLGLTNDQFTGPELSEEDGYRPLLGVRCQRGAVVLTLEERDDVALTFRWDEKSGRLRLVHTAAVQRALVLSPLSGADAERRAAVRALARAALEGAAAAGPDGGPASQLGGIDQAFVDGLTLSTARDAIEAGAWERGEQIVNQVSASWPSRRAQPFQPPLSLRKRAAQLREELADRRNDSEPVHVLSRTRLGTLKKVQALPIDPGLAPTLFWRRGEVCVAQEDASGTMRCYAPEARRWGPRLPVETPVSSARGLKQLDFGSRGMESCLSGPSLALVVRKEVPDDRVNPCERGPGSDLADVLAVVDGSALLRVGFQLDRGGNEGEPLSVALANEAFARSAGGLLTGNGSSRFLRDGRLALVADDGERRWDVLRAAGPGQSWAAPPLVSPDQRWVVAQSQQGGTVTLWLFHLSPSIGP